MKVAIRGLAYERVLPSLWAFGLDAAAEDEAAAVLLCGDGEPVRPEDPPRVVWTTGPLGLRDDLPAALVRSPPRAGPAVAPAPAADAAMAEVLAALMREYTNQLPQALVELARAVIDARGGAGSLADARMLAHRLRGTAGSYGHPAVGEAAGRLEDQLVAGELASAPLAASLDAIAAPVVAALWPGALPAGPRVLVIGAPPAGPADVLVCVPDLAAAARAAAAGEGHALWLGSDDPEATAAVLREPGLWDIPVAVVRDATDAAAAVAFACLWPGPWSWLFGPGPMPGP